VFDFLELHDYSCFQCNISIVNDFILEMCNIMLEMMSSA